LTARTALITGGSSGIGLAIGTALAGEGYGLTIVSRRPKKLDAALEVLTNEGVDAQPVCVDLREEVGVRSAIDAHSSRFGRLDVLVNNAGVAIEQPLVDTDLGTLDLQLAVNLRAYVMMIHAALPLLKAAGAEHRKALIVNTASDVAKSGVAGLAVYSATKAGVVGLSQSVAKEVGPCGIQVTALCPSFVDTPMTAHLRDRIPPEAMIRPDDLAEAVRLLLRLSPTCHIPEVIFQRPGEVLGTS
jgi:NAD(P)-dependent dehydrogenase (short-subunit alcohol dehydrogenase family)